MHEPVADSLQVIEELLVCPCSPLKHKEAVVWPVSAGMLLDIVCSKLDWALGDVGQ